MSAAHTRQKIDRMKLTPTDLALASASQAVHSATKPSARRSDLERPGQPAGPAFSAQAPPSTQTSVAIHQAAAGGRSVQPAHSARPQAAASATPKAIAPAPGTPFNRAHSQPAAPIATSVSSAN